MGSTNPNSPSRMDGLARREQILGVAVQLFEQRSFAEVSTGDIAEAAGVARPLIHHYFGTKRELYLEAVRRIAYLPPFAFRGLPPPESVEVTAQAVVDYWISVVTRHSRLWLATINLADRSDEDVARIVGASDEETARRVIDCFDLDLSADQHARMLALLLAYAAMVKEISRQWLVAKEIEVADVRATLTTMLIGIANHVASSELPDPDRADNF